MASSSKYRREDKQRRSGQIQEPEYGRRVESPLVIGFQRAERHRGRLIDRTYRTLYPGALATDPGSGPPFAQVVDLAVPVDTNQFGYSWDDRLRTYPKTPLCLAEPG